MKLIVEMEMPTRCPCVLAVDNIGWFSPCFAEHGISSREKDFDDCIENGTRPDWCPIKGVLPEQHGDLVDADTVLWEVPDSEGIVPPMPVTIADVIEGYDVPIVIAAERSET